MPRRDDARPALLVDVAREAGVSVPTVSRVLNGTARVSADKSDRVHAAVERLGYRPNPAARALVRGERSMVAVLTADTTRYGYATTLQGIEEAARRAGLAVTITVVESAQPEHVRRTIDLVMSQPVAGAVVLEYDRPGVAALRALPSSLPVVAAAAVPRRGGPPQVVMDDRAGAAEAVEHLLGLGHPTVHHLAIPSSGRPAGRTTGWREALERAGVEPPPVLRATWEPEAAHALGLEIARRDDVTALLCGNDELALAVLGALARSGRRVPEDISVVGFDGHPLGRFWAPALTTVVQDFTALGRAAFDLLAAVLRGDDVPPTTRLEARLLVRGSTSRHLAAPLRARA